MDTLDLSEENQRFDSFVERNEHNVDAEANEARMSKTPIQFVYPFWFKCMHRLGCCRHRSFEVTEQAQEDLREIYKIERLADKYLKKHGVIIENSTGSSQIVNLKVTVDDILLRATLNSSVRSEAEFEATVETAKKASLAHETQIIPTEDSFDPLKNLGIGYYAFFKTQEWVVFIMFLMFMLATVMVVYYHLDSGLNTQFFRSLQTISLS